MLVGFVGDVHGRILDALAAVITWQARSGRCFDLIVQVGDMGAYPDLADLDPVNPATHPHLALDPSEADFSRLLRATGKRAADLRRVRSQLNSPIYFIRGNHEDFGWLRQLPVDGGSGTARVDPFALLRYVPDGSVLRFGDLWIGFLGGAEPEPGDQSDEVAAGAIDPGAYRSLLQHAPGSLDVLVTHDAPYGISVGYHGQIQGSRLISDLVEHLQPRFHVAGHLALNGPRMYGRTTFLCLSSLRASIRWNPEAGGLKAGCLAVLDTATADLWPVTDAWLSSFARPLDFDTWVKQVLPG